MRARSRVAPAAALLLALLACAESERPFERIVLVSLDTVRADHLGFHGYPAPTSPFLDELAEASVVFERAYTSMPTTAPAHATLLTGLQPVQHRVERNGDRLDAGYQTLAEVLRARGFTTAGFSATRAHFGPSNLHQGFEHFDEPARSEAAPYRPADATCDAVLAWLRDRRPPGPLFLMVHLYDAHHPWRPPARHRRAVAAGIRAAEHVRYLLEDHGLPLDFFGSEARLLDSILAYDGEIRFVDAELHGLFEADHLESRGARTLWVVTADHGAGLGNHRWMFHGKHLYEEQVRVPLLFHATDGSLPARRVGGVVSQVDLFPTLLALAGVEETGPGPGRSRIDALRGGSVSGGSALVQRRRYDPNPEADRRAATVGLSADNRYEPGEKFALVDGAWKLVHHTAGPDALYDLGADPTEARDRSGREPERVRRMARTLRERLRRLRTRAGPEPEPVDPETAQRLEALGYAP